jgi:hypothetical protein
VHFAIQVVCNVTYIEVWSYVRVIVICMAGIAMCKRSIVRAWGSVVVKALRY